MGVGIGTGVVMGVDVGTGVVMGVGVGTGGIVGMGVGSSVVVGVGVGVLIVIGVWVGNRFGVLVGTGVAVSCGFSSHAAKEAAIKHSRTIHAILWIALLNRSGALSGFLVQNRSVLVPILIPVAVMRYFLGRFGSLPPTLPHGSKHFGAFWSVVRGAAPGRRCG